MTRPLLAFALLSVSPVPGQQPAQPASVALTNVTVVDVRTGRSRPGMTVVLAGGRIAAIGAGGAVPRGTQSIDGSGKFLIPGLWDMHVHLAFGDWFPGAREISLPLFIANGVTGVRDMG